MGEQTFLDLLEGALREHPEWVVSVRERLERSQAGRLLDIAGMAHLLNCSAEHLERLVASGELKPRRDYIDVSSRNTTRRMLRFRPEQVIKTLSQPR